MPKAQFGEEPTDPAALDNANSLRKLHTAYSDNRIAKMFLCLVMGFPMPTTEELIQADQESPIKKRKPKGGK